MFSSESQSSPGNTNTFKQTSVLLFYYLSVQFSAAGDASGGVVNTSDFVYTPLTAAANTILGTPYFYFENDITLQLWFSVRPR